MAESFLGRWSQRKQAVRAGKALDEPAAQPLPLVAQEQAQADASPAATHSPVEITDGPPVHPAAHAQPSPLSLDDVTRLTAQSDFAPFVARDVAPDVRNAAMKKLFGDPHFNVMDGLDIYIDDYSQPDPLPESMLRQMASAKFLKLFEDEDEDLKDQPQSRVRDDTNTSAGDSVAQSEQLPETGVTPLPDNTPQARGTDDDNTDLRLQPNHAAGPREPGRGPE